MSDPITDPREGATEIADIEGLNPYPAIRFYKRPASILKKIQAIYREINPLPKDGQNKAPDASYSFVSVGAMKAMLLPLMAKHGLVALSPVLLGLETSPFTTASGKTRTMTRARFAWEFCDADTGDSLVIESMGEALDNQDKGLGKAQTAFMKNVIKGMFLIPEANEDADAFDHAEEEDDPRFPPCPACGKADPMESRFHPGFLYCNQKRGGCGNEWKPEPEKPAIDRPAPTPQRIQPQPIAKPEPAHEAEVYEMISDRTLDPAKIDPHLLAEIRGNMQKAGFTEAQADHRIRQYTGTARQLADLSGGWALDAEQKKQQQDRRRRQ